MICGLAHNSKHAATSAPNVAMDTLRNWRAMKIGPTFVKIGKAVLYPTNELDAWDQTNTVTCRASKGRNVDKGERA
ncbi:hypothetical protein [Bradyrhizobium elkanii]|uniref:hypothetical protein n=1 Tax=Bradyrhizobium elkanii TaxID=29448 RepID=UPI0006887399|nr:hypothetical protein [Bradyrhizobium elkanii]